MATFAASPLRLAQSTGGEGDEPFGLRDVGRIQCPHLVGPVDIQSAQQVGIHFIPRVLLAGAGLPEERRHTHARHQRADVYPPDRVPLPIQLVAHHARAHERVLQVQCIQATHQPQIGRADRRGDIVDAARLIPARCAWRLIDRA